MIRTLVIPVCLLVAATHPVAVAQNPQTPTAPPQRASAAGAGAPNAQAAAPGEIKGRIVDGKSNQPVARASVSVRAKGGTAILTGAIASGEGTFRLIGLRPGTYTLRTTYIGFAPVVQEVTIAAASPVTTVGDIKLSHVAVELAAVSVQEERSTVSVEPDRSSYRAKDVAPAAANASEVLDAVPSVQVDADGKVSYRGNENVAVQINGRPTPLRGAQLASFLKGIPANTLERVEVVPNPSAKYDPEGMAGIINIVLKQSVDLGLSTSVNAAMSQADRFNASGNVGYQAGKISSFTTVGVNRDARNVIGLNDRERYDALSALASVTAEDIDGATSFTGENVTSSLDYRLTNRDVLSNALTISHRSGTDNSANAFAELDALRAPVASYFRPRNTETTGLTLDYNLALKRTFEPRKHELSAEARLNRSDDRDEQTLWRMVNSGGTNTFTEGEHDDNNSSSRQITAQVDYTKTFGKRSKLETGYKGNERWLDRDYLVEKDALGTGAWTTDPLSNSFDFDEAVHAAYAVVSQGAGKFDLQGGLRGERASRDFSLGATDYPYRYNSLFPSASVLYNATQSTQLKASYSRRIRRPGTQELNPFVQYFDVQNVFIGNPSLAPEYTDAYETSVVKNMSRGTLTVSPFFRSTSNIIRVDINTTDTIAGREVTSISFQNLASANSWGADVNGSLRLGSKLNGFAGFNVFKMVTDGGSTSSLGSNAVTWMGRVNASSDVSKTVTLQAAYFYRAPMKIERGQFDRFHFMNFSVRRKLNGDKASVTLRVNDPFGTGTFRVHAGDEKVMQITQRNFGMRTAWLAFQWNYGRPPRLRQPKQDEQQAGSTGFPTP